MEKRQGALLLCRSCLHHRFKKGVYAIVVHLTFQCDSSRAGPSANTRNQPINGGQKKAPAGTEVDRRALLASERLQTQLAQPNFDRSSCVTKIRPYT